MVRGFCFVRRLQFQRRVLSVSLTIVSGIQLHPSVVWDTECTIASALAWRLQDLRFTIW